METRKGTTGTMVIENNMVPLAQLKGGIQVLGKRVGVLYDLIYEHTRKALEMQNEVGFDKKHLFDICTDLLKQADALKKRAETMSRMFRRGAAEQMHEDFTSMVDKDHEHKFKAEFVDDIHAFIVGKDWKINGEYSRVQTIIEWLCRSSGSLDNAMRGPFSKAFNIADKDDEAELQSLFEIRAQSVAIEKEISLLGMLLGFRDGKAKSTKEMLHPDAIETPNDDLT